MNHKYLLSFILVFLTIIAISPMAFATAGDISTATYANKSISISTQSTSPAGLVFSQDGTKAYSFDYSNKKAWQYTLSTAWDISTASYANKSFDFSSKIPSTNPWGAFASTDGTKFYLLTVNGYVYQYTASTAWDISTLSDASKSLNTGFTYSTGITINPNGNKVYILNYGDKKVYQYTMSTAWDISTATYDNKNFTSAQDNDNMDLSFDPYGNYFYIIGKSNDRIYQYNLTTAWDVSTATYSNKYLSIASQDNAGESMFFRQNPTSSSSTFYIAGLQNRSIYQYNYDVNYIPTYTVTPSQTTETYNNDLNITLTTDQPDSIGIYYTTDGSTPDNTDTEYTGAITISGTTTLKAVSYDGSSYSEIMSETYTMIVSDPVITQTTGTYNNDFTTTITSETTGASIYYTTDGSVPDNTDTLYSGAITINATTTLKAIAYKTSYTTSGVDTETYTMEVFGTATADYNSGIYYEPINVTLTKNGFTTNEQNYSFSYQNNAGRNSINYNSNDYITNVFVNARTFPSSIISSELPQIFVQFNYEDLSTYTTPKQILNTTNYQKFTFTNINEDKNVTSFKVILWHNTTFDNLLLQVRDVSWVNYFNTDYTKNTTLTYTTNGTDPTIASTEYTTPITIDINNDANTTLKFAEFKTGYTPSAIQTLEFDIRDANLNIQFYDENTLTKLDGNVSIVDLTNATTYYTDENGFFSRYLTDIDWKEKQINAYVERKVDGVTTHTSRNLQFYWKNQDQDYNFLLLPIDEGENIEFLVKDTNDILWESKYVQFYNSNTKTILTPYIIDSNADELSVTGTSKVILKTFDYGTDYKYITKANNKMLSSSSGTAYCDYNFIYYDNTYEIVTNSTTQQSPFLAKTYTNPYPNKPVTKIQVLAYHSTSNSSLIKDDTVTSDGNYFPGHKLVSSNKTDSEGKFTSYLKTDGNYTATLYDAIGTEGDTYQKTTVNVKKPKNEKSLADISPYDVEVGGLLIYSLSNQTAAQTSINIFGGTTSTYDFTVVDYNADPVDRVYIPRTYNVKNPFGLAYSTTYNLQPYLITKEDGVIPSIVVYDELKTPFPGITVAIFKQISGSLQLVEQKVTDSTGRTSFAGFPLDVYYIYLYDDGELKGSYQIQVRDTGETFYFVIQRDQIQDIIYKGLDLKYSWNNTPEYVELSTDNVDVNVSVYADYVGDFNITGYTIKTYQNGALKETETGGLSGTSVTFTESFNRLNYTAGMPIKVVVDVTFTYAGQTKNLNIIKTIAVDSKTSGLLNVLQNFPEKVGVLWTILLSILLTIGLLVLVGTSDFVSKDYLIYVGLLVIGFFVYIGWMATGIEVFGMDSMWFIYIVTVIAAVGFALQDSQR